ncbi:MAG: right-handed parallel beta-helix repeat-containing protein [Planctomycetota bacterium]|jgi:hypothetical protein
MKQFKIIMILALSVSVLADVYWIDSKAGGRATGSPQRPYVSFKEAIGNCGGGHTFIFKPGIYNDGQMTIRPPHRGTPQNPTVLKSQGKYKAVLHGAVSHGIFIKENTPWVIIDGFEVSGARYSGIKSLADYTVIRNCFIHNNNHNGIEAHAVNHCVFENNLIEFNGHHPSYQHGIYADGDDLGIRNNVIRRNASCGLALGPALSNSAVSNNLIHDNGGWGVSWDSKPGIGGNSFLHNTIANNSLGVAFRDGGYDTLLYNIIAYNYRQSDPNYSQIQHRKGSSFEKITIENNVIFPCPNKFKTKNTEVEPPFLDASRGLFFLKKKIGARVKKTGRWPETDFFGNKQTDPNRFDVGCFMYDPNLLREDYRKEWYMGWPYYFPKEGNVIPDFWQYPGSLNK